MNAIESRELFLPIDLIQESLSKQGWVLLRGYDFNVNSFSDLMHVLCGDLTFDPARDFASKDAQVVDAGTAAVGLHIENGNTPLPPDIVAFYSALSASKGSQTTICDGHALYHALSDSQRELFSNDMTVSRFLPDQMWKRYVATALKMGDWQSATLHDLKRFCSVVPNQSFEPAADGGIYYQLRFSPILNDNFSGLPSFANAILGPSYNYAAPVYRFADGSEMPESMKDELEALAEKFTEEVQWQDGDVVVIDNKRVMHGRREICVPLCERKLYIGMGLKYRLNLA
jgi:alpha-ketoglutarate-dependent taurine dioxygenase